MEILATSCDLSCDYSYSFLVSHLSFNFTFILSLLSLALESQCTNLFFNGSEFQFMHKDRPYSEVTEEFTQVFLQYLYGFIS